MTKQTGSIITKSKVQAYLQRDWGALEKASHSFWRKRLRKLGPPEGIRVADELWRQARAQHPNWPDQATRQEDLEAHVRLSEIFRKVARAWNRSTP